MFSADNVAVRVADISHRSMEKDDAEIPLTDLKCEVSPLTPKLAGDLNDFVRRTLYTSKDVEVNTLLGTATFNIDIRPQEIEFRAAPDQDEPSFTIGEAEISGIKAKRSKKSTAWVLEFTITCSPESERQLHQIVESYIKTRYLTFTDAVPSLFEKDVDETPKLKRGRGAAAAGAEATRTH